MRLRSAIISLVILASYVAQGHSLRRDGVATNEAETYQKGYRSVAYFVNWVRSPNAAERMPTYVSSLGNLRSSIQPSGSPG